VDDGDAGAAVWCRPNTFADSRGYVGYDTLRRSRIAGGAEVAAALGNAVLALWVPEDVDVVDEHG
jgi:hypothetical protein